MDERYPAPAAFTERAYLGSRAAYEAMYRRSVEDPEAFWRDMGQRIDWFKPFTRVKNTSWERENVSIQWYEDGTTNAAHNALDRHLATRGGQTALIFEPDDPAEPARHISYRELHAEVGRLANVLKANGVRKGDRVTIYLPMIPEAAYAMLACARIGAIHSVVFGGFSPDSLASRIQDCDSTVLITADEGKRGGKFVPLKMNADKALEQCPGVTCTLV
ncbi:MAG: AMP-binding protein, partial [Bacteroidetes bacterium]|nr:AMP-binding protein [Bacteroidota bacterium]